MTLDRLRVPFLVLAILLNLILVMAEAGLPGYEQPLAALLTTLNQTTQSAETNISAQDEMLQFFPGDQADLLQEKLSETTNSANQLQTFGYGLRSLWLVDGLLLFSLALIGLGVILPPAWQARIQGILTLVFALFVIISAIPLILEALAKVILMISVLLAFPFGTIVYLIKWGDFDRSGAAGILAVFFTLKFLIGGAMLLAQQRFIQNMGLVVIFILALVANIIVSFLHGLVPGFLVSITDGIAGIVVGILGVILALVLLIQAIFSTIAGLKP